MIKAQFFCHHMPLRVCVGWRTLWFIMAIARHPHGRPLVGEGLRVFAWPVGPRLQLSPQHHFFSRFLCQPQAMPSKGRGKLHGAWWGMLK